MLPKIIKRDGTLEKFSIINIGKVVTAAGLNPQQAKTVAENISTWAEQLSTESITSLQVRDQVIHELEQINVNAAELYKWYEQSKEQ